MSPLCTQALHQGSNLECLGSLGLVCVELSYLSPNPLLTPQYRGGIDN